MKALWILAVMTTLTVLPVFTQNKNGEQEVAEAVEQLRVAMIKGDRKGLERAAVEELSYGHSGGAIENKTEFVEKIVSGKSDFINMDLSDQTITITDNAAIVRHELSAETNDNGKPGNVRLHVLTVWQKQHGKWKMIARQAVKRPG